jgi:hypothetical protein
MKLSHLSLSLSLYKKDMVLQIEQLLRFIKGLGL